MIRLTVPGRPIPAERMTQRTKWTQRAQRALAYQRLVAQVAALTVRPRPLPWTLLRISIRFYFRAKKGTAGRDLPGNRPDLDNIAKAVLDGLKFGGVFQKDDRAVIELLLRVDPCEYEWDERAEIELGEAHKGG